MFHRFASVLFGDEPEEVSARRPAQREEEEDDEEEEEWILVDYLADACSRPLSDGLSGLAGAPEPEDEDDDLVMVPSPTGSPALRYTSPTASPALRYASCTSLDSSSDTDPDGGPEEEEEEEEGGFLQLQTASLEESWFVTPPPCFTGGRGRERPLLEPSPLEDLLIEHPSMSVYAPRARSPLTRGHRDDLSLTRGHRDDLSLTRGHRDLSLGAVKTAVATETGRRSLDPSPRHRSDVVQRCSGVRYAAAAVSGRAGEQAGQAPPGGQGQLEPRVQPLSRRALRRLNLLRNPGNLLRHPGSAKQSRTTAMFLHQPGHRHLNY